MNIPLIIAVMTTPILTGFNALLPPMLKAAVPPSTIVLPPAWVIAPELLEPSLSNITEPIATVMKPIRATNKLSFKSLHLSSFDLNLNH